MQKINNNKQSMILIKNHDIRNELADCTEGWTNLLTIGTIKLQ